MARGLVSSRVVHERDEDKNITRIILIETYAVVTQGENGVIHARSEEEESVIWEKPEVAITSDDARIEVLEVSESEGEHGREG